MNARDLRTVEQLREFLEGVRAVAFEVPGGKAERYEWMRQVLARFLYPTLGRRDKGTVVRYLMKVTGYSREQVFRLIRQYGKTGRLDLRPRSQGQKFTRRYTVSDIRLLAAMDERHNTPNGLAVKKLCERACQVFGQQEYARLATISVSHLYNLRRSTGYRRQRTTLDKTRPRPSSIGERRKPQPRDRPGYIRVDTVHQGDWDGQKGVYHINAVDEVTQFEMVVSVEKISEHYLVPALEQLVDSFPFTLHNFHSDNGSEYVNKRVAKLLEKLRIEFTKSRPRRSNDNALVEGKNGHVIRKLFGYTHIPPRWAETLNHFHRLHTNPYHNYHRPCLFSETLTDPRGKQRKRYPYRLSMTPYDKLKSLPQAHSFLKPGVTFEKLDALAHEITDNEAAERMNQARSLLFQTISQREFKRA